MDKGYASQLQAFSKAALLGLVLFSMATWVPHGLSCLRSFLFVSLPCAASGIVTPKCLFVFSNIIVVFLATESKLTQNSAAQSPGCDDDIDVVVRELAVFAPSIKENHAAEETVEEERGVNVAAARMSTEQLGRCGKEEMREQEGDVLLANDDGDGQRMQVEDEVLLEEVTKEEDCGEEATELPTDELNRRVEDFIARFNMERQLEARMIICCC
uniref:Uncharacterized protein n=1 Tax=Avena sativa TaxID=4498 RepID=A0ACD5VQZ0_AVESA